MTRLVANPEVASLGAWLARVRFRMRSVADYEHMKRTQWRKDARPETDVGELIRLPPRHCHKYAAWGHLLRVLTPWCTNGPTVLVVGCVPYSVSVCDSCWMHCCREDCHRFTRVGSWKGKDGKLRSTSLYRLWNEVFRYTLRLDARDAAKAENDFRYHEWRRKLESRSHCRKIEQYRKEKP